MQVIYKNFKISRIRNFYMRKVKFTQDSFDEKLGVIFPSFEWSDDVSLVDRLIFCCTYVRRKYIRILKPVVVYCASRKYEYSIK